MAAPLVSVVMAARNAAPFLREAIDSVRAQTVGDWELIVVDDASTDETPEIVEGYARDDARVFLVRRDQSGGPYAAANTGLQYARGRYVARLDADDVALPCRLERQLGFLSAHPELRACASSVTVLKDGRLEPFRVRATPTLPGALRWGLCVRGFLQSTALVERDALRKIGGYCELPVSQDHRMWCELALRRWLGALPDPLVQWRVHRAQLSESKLELQRRLGAEVVRDHLKALGFEWSTKDVELLRALSYRPVGWRAGRQLVARFEEAWRADVSLDAAERHELEILTRRLRFEHARETVRSFLEGRAGGRATMRIVRALRGGLSRG